MASLYFAHDRHRCRSASAPPSRPAVSEVEATRKFAMGARISVVDDFETITYRETRHRRAVLSLANKCSKECSATRQKVGWRNNMFRGSELVRRFTDTNIDYDQQLMYLDFRLAGPDRIHFLPDDDAEEAAASLHRARTAASNAGWQMQRAAHLWDLRGGPSTEQTGRAQQKQTARPENIPKPNPYTAYIQQTQDARFWNQVRPDFEVLLASLQDEVLRIRYVVYCLDSAKKQEVAYLLGDFSRGERFKRLLLCDFASTVQPEKRSDEMSGALQRATGRKNHRTLFGALRLRFDRVVAGEEAPTSAWIHYKFIKHCDKRRSPEESIAAWEAFRRELDSTRKPFNAGTALLKNKVETKIILAEHQLRQLAGGSGANGGWRP